MARPDGGTGGLGDGTVARWWFDVPVRRQRRGFVMAAVVMGLTTMFAPSAIGGQGDEAPTPAAAPPPLYSPTAPPPVSAQSVYVMDATRGTALFAQNADERLAPASLAKIAAALVVLEHADFDERIEIVESDLVTDNESRVGLVAGDTLSARDLFTGLLVPSGNDAARAFGRVIGGRLDPTATDPDAAIAVFVDEMNRTVERLGLTDTRFANPSGIDAPEHYTSAHDIARLTAAALAHDVFREAIGTTEVTLPSEVNPEGYLVRTTHNLVREGTAIGGKTGTTPGAGGNLMSIVRIGANDVVAVVLGSPLDENPDGLLSSSARYADTGAIVAGLQSDYVWFDPVDAGLFVGLPDELAVWQAYVGERPPVVAPVGREQELRYRLVLGPTGAPDSEVGRVLFFVGSELLSEQPVLQSQ